MRVKLVLAAAALLLMAGAARAAQETANIAIPKASTGAVFIARGDFDKAVAARAAGTTLSGLGAVRAQDDRINVDVLKRTDPNAEGPVVHQLVTEIYYILDGGGQMETGGKIDDPQPMLTGGRPTNPANIGPSFRGTKMSGGSLHHVSAGDVVMIPPGVPHRFKSLDGTVTYMVVRVNPGYEKGR